MHGGGEGKKYQINKKKRKCGCHVVRLLENCKEKEVYNMVGKKEDIIGSERKKNLNKRDRRQIGSKKDIETSQLRE